MYGLIYNNLKQLKLSFLVFSFFILSTVALSSSIDETDTYYYTQALISYFMIFVFTNITLMQIHTNEEKKLWSSFVIASPCGGDGHIKSRYLSILIFNFIAFCWCWLTELFVLIIGDVEESLLFSMYSTFFFINLFVCSIEIPFIVRFGCKRGNNIRAGIILGAIAIIVIYFLFGDISMFSSLDEFINNLMDILSGKKSNSFLIASIAVFPYISLTFFYISYKISCRLYLKGVESYEL